MGLVAGVVFAPCVGPVVVGILAYVATTGDIALGGGLLATVALGTGAPFLLIGTFSGELLRLPRMGGAPDVVRFILGSALLMAALYYLRITVAAELFRVLAVGALALLGLDRLTIARRGHSRTWATTGVALFFLAGAIGFLPPRAGGPPLAWRTDVEAALADARRARRFAVIDFTADWCLACHELDLVTFRDPDVARLLEETERIRVDATRMTGAVERLFARFGVLALPSVVVVDPEGTVVEAARIVSFVPPKEALSLFRRAGIQPQT
jgi:thiol:disulfide interchange protein DsbD